MSQSVLNTITAARQRSLQRQLEQLDIAALTAHLPPSVRSLADALRQPYASFILECKQASPSHGVLRQHWDPRELALAYSPYAAAISVLTEPDYFHGDFRDLAVVANSVSQPVLCKDFIVQPEHVLLARYFGADAILLMLAVLTDAEYLALVAVAERYQLDVLTEISTPAELARAIRLNANIIGINNRNLHDLSIDCERTLTLAPKIPPQTLVVAASGYHEHAQIRAAAPAVDGFLIGSSLTAKANVDQACRELIYGHHKICGLTEAKDAQVARAAGAAYGGLIFVPHSPRCLTLEQAQQVTKGAPELSYVGVFANQPLDLISHYANTLQLTAIQLHGQEDEAFVQALTTRVPHAQIWRAMAVTGPITLPTTGASRLILDSPGGGSGQPFAWHHLTQLPPAQRQQLMLAGGLAASNLAAAQQTGIQQFDLNSGVETAPGRKDAGQINRVFQHLRSYGRIPMQPIEE